MGATHSTDVCAECSGIHVLWVSLMNRLCILREYLEKGKHQDKILKFFVDLKWTLRLVCFTF